MSRFLEAQVALDMHLNDMPGVPPIARENAEYTPIDGVLYIRPTNLPAGSQPLSLDLGGTVRTVGIYQIDVFAPMGEGAGPALIVADAIAEHFSRGARLVNGDSTVVLGVPAQEPARPSGARHMVSVLIPYDNLFRS